MYVLQTLPYISTEDPNSLTITGNVGAAGGTELLTASGNGAVLAGVSNPSNVLFDSKEAVVTIVDAASRKISGRFTYTPPAGLTVSPYSFGMSADGSVGYIGIYDAPPVGQAQIAVLSLPTGSTQTTFSIPQGSYGVDFIALSPSGASLFSLAALQYGFIQAEEFCSTDLTTFHRRAVMEAGCLCS